jgi:hypothetical protein
VVEEQHIVEQEHDKALVQEEQEEHAGVVEGQHIVQQGYGKALELGDLKEQEQEQAKMTNYISYWL